jgi:hypothetical protein
MADPYAPKPEHKFSFGLWTSAIADAIRSATWCATRCRRSTPSRSSPKSARGA